MMSVLLILFGPLLAILFFKLLFKTQSTEQVIAQNKHLKNHSVNKYPEVDTSKFSTIFLQIGLLVALSACLYAFTYTTAPANNNTELTGLIMDELETEILPPITHNPPPPPAPPVIEVVENEDMTDEDISIFDTEADTDTEIDIVPVIDEDIDIDIDIDADNFESEYQETVEEPEIFDIVEEMPEFPGGQQAMFGFIGNTIKYPPTAREASIQGTVYVAFIIDTDGSVTNIEIKRGIPNSGAGINTEAMRVISLMPKWKPGKQRGKTVKVRYILPIKFKLS